VAAALTAPAAAPIVAPRIETLLRRQHPGTNVLEVRAFTDGYSSLTYGVSLSGCPWPQVVAKVAPAGVPPTGNRDVLRQARILRAITSAATVAAPRILASDPGEPPAVPPLVLMEFVPGESVEPLTEPDPRRLPAPAVCAARAFAAARMLVALHELDPQELAATERPSTAKEEIARWARVFQAVDDSLRPPAAERCRAALARSVPPALTPTILHGDWRLGNLLCRDEEITAAIDWEIWSVGDPRLDLAWFALLADPDRPQNVRAPAGTGLPSPAALVGAYGDGRPGGTAALAWFAAFVRYKQAAATALLIRRARRRAAARSPESELRTPPLADPSAIDTLLNQALQRLE
jgi:aminoglycoside phosphotransferase (APT) family kinase protein